MAVHKLAGKATASNRSNNDLSKIDYSKIKFIPENQVLGVWTDEIYDRETTLKSGIIIQNTLATQKARWLYVVKSSVDDVAVGSFVLPQDVVEPFGCVIDGVEHFRCHAKDLIMATDSYDNILAYEEF